MTAASQNIKNGQQLNTLVGSGAVASGDIMEIGGPGAEAWSVATMDYAAVASAGSLLAQTSAVAAALPGSARQPLARDKLGNIYLLGTNSSGNLVAYKFGPLGTVIASATLDATATSVNSPHVFQLQNGSFAAVYARAAGALYTVVFDATLNVIAGPVLVGTERAATNVVYHSACALTGGGFAVAFQTSAGTAINLVTYSNAGAVVQAATSIQALGGSAAQAYLKLSQLASGNLLCAYRSTMTAGGIAGTSFTICTVAGALFIGPVSVDTTSTLGFVETSALPTTFAVAVADGTNIIAAVFNFSGVQQGGSYSVGNTLNSIAYPQLKLTNDGIQFWMVWFSSVANGVYVIALSAAGVAGTSASGLGSASINASTFALDAEVLNNLIVVLAASSGTAGQLWMSIGLPDASLGIINPYVRTAPAAFGTAAATTGSNWPRVLSGGGGLYQGTSPPLGQPAVSSHNGDFTVIFAYDQQNTAETYLGIQKVENSAVVGASLKTIVAGSAGSNALINPGPGEYPTNNVTGSSGMAFNHIGLIPSGTAGTMYTAGGAFSGIGGSAAGVSGPLPTGFYGPFAGATAPAGWLLCAGQAISRAAFATLFGVIGTTYGIGDGSTTFNVPDMRGRVVAGADNMGGTPANRLGGGATGGITGSAVPGASGGEQSHQITIAELAAHTHTQGFVNNADAQSVGGPVLGGTAGALTGLTGSDTPHNNTQPTLVGNYIIKT